MGIFYAETPGDIDKVVNAATRAFDRGEAIGLDTEFYGVEVGKQSCVGRSKLHLLSIGVRRHPGKISPRGYYTADAAVLPRRALDHRGIQDLLTGPGPKCVHNLPVDAHTLENEGIRLGGGINTLAIARWAWPGRARGRGFTLDALGQDIVGLGKSEGFSEIFTETVTEFRSTFRRVRACECGADPCRKRSSAKGLPTGHTRVDKVVETRHPRDVERPIPLETVVPGHPRWQRALVYSANDALLALHIYDLALLEMNKEIEVPWM